MNQFAGSPRIEMCEQDVIDTFGSLPEEFFLAVLDTAVEECLLTDESSLSDFFPRGALLPGGVPYQELLRQWDIAISDKVERLFGVRPARTTDRLVVLFDGINQHRSFAVRRH